MKRILIIASLGLVLTGGVWGSYQLLAKFLQDRQTAQRFQPRPVRQLQTNTGPRREVKRYTQKELEELRKKGQRPNNQLPPAPVQPNTAANDAVQRSLRTVQEINRINEMNRRLMEQQQRMQQQSNR